MIAILQIKNNWFETCIRLYNISYSYFQTVYASVVFGQLDELFLLLRPHLIKMLEIKMLKLKKRGANIMGMEKTELVCLLVFTAD